MSENAGTEQDHEPESDDEETETERSELVARVAAHDEALATAVEDRIAEAEADAEAARERAEELESSLARTRADFENYKDRAEKRREQAAARATADIVEKLTDVRNNLLRALDQDADADIRPGVESTLETFDRVLEEEGVTPVEPEPGTEVDPARHEVMVRVASDEPEGTVAEVYDPGYETGDTVIEAAKVTVSDGSGADDADGDNAETATDADESGENADTDGDAA
jgi:molecular chaperone GrpE